MHIRGLDDSGIGDWAGAKDCGSLGFARRGAESDDMAVVSSSGQHALRRKTAPQYSD